jgi:hypothetical protein
MNLQCKILHYNILQKYYKSSLNSSTQHKQCVCGYFVRATLNFALSLLRIVTWVVNCWKSVCQHRMYYSENKTGLAFGLWIWCLFLVLILCTDEFVRWISWLLIMQFINESIHWHGTGRISGCFNRLPHAVLGCASTIILTISSVKWKYSHC